MKKIIERLDKWLKENRADYYNGLIRQFPQKYATGRNELYIPGLIPEKELENEVLEFSGFDINATYSDSWKTFLNG